MNSQKHFCKIDRRFNRSLEILNPTLFRRIQIRWQNFTNIASNYPLTKNYFRSTKAISDERKKRSKKSWYIIHPFSTFNYIRQIIMILMYTSVWGYDIVRTVNLERTAYNYYYNLIGIPCNLLCFFDIIANFNTGFINTVATVKMHYSSGLYKLVETSVVMEKKEIVRHYLSTYFVIDLLCLLNYTICSTCEHYGYFNVNFMILPFRLLRFIRLKTVIDYFKIIIAHCRYQENIYTFALFIYIFLLTVFFFACMNCLIPRISAILSNKNGNLFVDTLVEKFIGADDDRSLYVFFHSFYLSLCLLVVGQAHHVQDSVDRYILTSITVFVGLLIQVYAFIMILLVLNRTYKSRLKYISFMEQVSNFLYDQKLDKKLSNEIKQYFEETLKREYFNEHEILNTLQRKMKFEVFTQTSMDLVRNCNLFHDLPTFVLIQLSIRLKSETFIPGVTVITVGEIATCMYFIATGTVAVYSADGTELCHLSDGEYVGEIGILQSTARVADIVTIEHCELYRLDIRDFQEVIKPNSKFYKRIYKIAMKRMNVHVTMETDNKKSLL